MRANFDEIVQYFEGSEFSMKSQRNYCSDIIAISCRCAKFCNWHFVRNFVWGSEISGNISSRGAKFRVTFRLAERNFVQHFIWRGEIRRQGFGLYSFMTRYFYRHLANCMHLQGEVTFYTNVGPVALIF